MNVLLVRHARAGHRETWDGDDRLRPLDKKGQRQALGLVDVLRPYGIERLVSSPLTRCVQTLEPLAGALGLAIEERPELAEGSTRADVLSLCASLDGATAAFSTHGDVVEEVIGRPLKKGALVELTVEGDSLREGREIPPPA